MSHSKSVLSSLLVLLLVTGCSTLSSHPVTSGLERPRECQAFMDRLDDAVGRAGVRDASKVPVAGFPYLRTDRFLTALKDRLKTVPEKQQWLQLMLQANLEAGEKEIRNLSDTEVLALEAKADGEEKLLDKENERDGDLKSAQGRARERVGEQGTADTCRRKLYASMKACSNALLLHDQTRSGFFEALYPAVKVPGEYSSLMRIAGLYPLASIPVALATERVHEKFTAWRAVPPEELPVRGKLIELTPSVPSPEGAGLDESTIKGMLKASTNNPLRIPLLGKEQTERVAAFFAPVFIQDVAAAYDLPGAVTRTTKGPDTDPRRPTVYYYTSYALLHHQPILQINYVAWYSERAGKGSPWMERGRLDGLTVRASLDTEGQVFMVDTMNNCGCYHLFAPRKDKVLRTRYTHFPLEPFVPQWLPEAPPGEKLGIRVNSGWHQVQLFLPVKASAGSASYELVSYDALESLPGENDHPESIFDAQGIARGTERIEPFIFFSMGIHSVGSMRQRGHHAIELVGRAHFDDPYIFEKSFVFRRQPE